MKDYSKKYLKDSFKYSDLDAVETIDFCLEQLYKDKKIKINQVAFGICTYEELIGALLAASKQMKYYEETIKDMELNE